jgi:hypothetical protein
MPYSSEWSRQPLQVQHLECGTTWDSYSSEWPPKIVICTRCHVGLKLVGHDATTKHLAYRQISL